MHLVSGLADITQISAVHDNKEFNKYVVPVKPITFGASMVTNLSTKDGQLFKNGVLVTDSVSIQSCLIDFKSFLSSIQNVILIGHNSENFDAIVLCNKFIQCNISFEGIIKGFIDTLPLFQSFLPGRKSYKQEALVKDSGMNYNAHDALEDCRALSSLINHHHIPNRYMFENSFTYDYALSKCRYRVQKQENLQSLTPLLDNKVITSYMASKIACSGLSYNHLKTVCRRDGSQGLLNIFREQSNGQPRVTKNSKIILEVVKFFNEH